MAGARLEAEWRAALRLSGCIGLEWGVGIDVFAGSAHESDAAEFNTRGVTFSANKPA